jgi:hypothetical protein
MAETFNRAAVALTTTSITDVYQAPNVASTDRAVVLSCVVANVDASANAGITITITDSSNVVQSRIANAIVVPYNASLEVIANKLILKRGEKIRATASVANRLEVTVSVLEIA